jgi:hypothetical protein
MAPATMMPATNSFSIAGQRGTFHRDDSHGRANSQGERGKGKGKSKEKPALIGNKRDFSGGNPSSRSSKSVKIERSNNRRSMSKSRGPTRPPAGASASSISGAYFEDRSGAGDIVAPSDKLQNHADAETGVNACKHFLEKQEPEVEFVFSDADDDEKGEVTDVESEKTVTPQPLRRDDIVSGEGSDGNQNQQDGPTGQGRK